MKDKILWAFVGWLVALFFSPTSVFGMFKGLVANA